ncbi:hypothetical protein [Pollutimonas bauzanensis]|jgi:predicted lipoprotein with Yx(FWY)xxD motif|uniref:COG4315 family predicted lipoprotein n=1 Tax=Pollutimonas bauzanensis TaxID=658167 RepID=UPI0033429C2D
MKKLLTILTLALAASTSVLAADAPIKKSGDILVNQEGMTLYTFDKDMANSGKSTCNGPCADNWPPLSAAQDATPSDKFTIITREDGTRQWAHDGKPLYLFKSDKKPGDRAGEDFKEVWHTVRD